MSYNIGFGLLVVHPTIPHDLMDIEGILWQSHGINDTTGAIVGLATMVSVGIREYYLGTTRRNARACAWTFTPVVIPATHHFNGKLIHVMVIVVGRFATIERTVAFFVEGIAVFIPIFAQPLVATILHSPHGVFMAFVDIQHLTTIFCLIDIQHLAATNGTTAVRVVLVANLFQFKHMLSRDTLVATFIKQDGRVVAVVDNGIAHHGLALLPTGTFHVFLSIAGGHCLR